MASSRYDLSTLNLTCELLLAGGNKPTTHPEMSGLKQNNKIQAEGKGSANTVTCLRAHKRWLSRINFVYHLFFRKNMTTSDSIVNDDWGDVWAAPDCLQIAISALFACILLKTLPPMSEFLQTPNFFQLLYLSLFLSLVVPVVPMTTWTNLPLKILGTFDLIVNLLKRTPHIYAKIHARTHSHTDLRPLVLAKKKSYVPLRYLFLTLFLLNCPLSHMINHKHSS